MPYQPVSQSANEIRNSLASVLRACAAHQEPPPLDPGIGAWIGHLFWLRSSLTAGTLLVSQLLEHEAEGLRLIDEVNREVRQKLHRCHHCGSVTESLLACTTCGRSLQSAAVQRRG